MTTRAAIDVRKVPDDIRRRVEAEAADAGMSRNDVIVRVLSSRYGVPYESTGYRKQQPDPPGSDQWVVRMPAVLRAAIRAHAKAIGGTQPGVILLALADHYGLPSPSPRKRLTRRLPDDVVQAARRRHHDGESLRSLADEYGVTRGALTAAIRREEVAA